MGSHEPGLEPHPYIALQTHTPSKSWDENLGFFCFFGKDLSSENLVNGDWAARQWT